MDVASTIRRVGNRALAPARRLALSRRAARLVADPGTFMVRQRRRDPEAHAYRLRSGLTVFIRHDANDAYALEECFGPEPVYELPDEVAAAFGPDGPVAILDLGANIGLFGLSALARFPAATVTGYEADPANAELHARCAEANRLNGRWTLNRAFAAAADGDRAFAAAGSGLSHGAEPGEPGTIQVEARDVLPDLARADFAKIDIEGGEWELLADPRLAAAGPRALVLESHGRGAPPGHPSDQACESLRGAGYRIAADVRRIPSYPDLGWGTIWAVRR